MWAADLVDMQHYSNLNEGYNYILMVIDVFSKFGLITPLKDKKGETVLIAVQKLFKEGGMPNIFGSIKLYNQLLKDLLYKRNVHIYSTENNEKSSVVERWNRAINSNMWKQFTIQGSTRYIDILPKMLKR